MLTRSIDKFRQWRAQTGRFWAGRQAGEELRAHAPILPVLSRQLEAAAQDMETEVSNVCRRFHSIASRARSTVSNASELLGDGNGDGAEVATAIRECRETMIQLLKRMEVAGELSAKAIVRMEQVESGVGRVAAVLQQVDQAAFASRIVALNAKIEAVHLGDAGRGFEFVAEEIASNADRSAQMVDQVGSILTTLVDETRQAATEFREVSAADQQWIGSSRKDIYHTLNTLEQANDQMRASLNAASEQSAELARDIESALVDLQFQDRVNQRIHHVATSLDAMHQSISRLGEDAPSAKLEERRKEIAASLASSYTMESERIAHGGDGGEDQRTDDVELF